jgi:hypothetical protein
MKSALAVAVQTLALLSKVVIANTMNVSPQASFHLSEVQ